MHVVALASLKGPHRVEWFGRVFRGSASYIEVVFAPWGTNPDTGEVGGDANQLTTLVVPVSLLSLFRIGDIWENCRNTGQVDVQTRQTFHLAVGDKNPEILPVGAPLLGSDGTSRYPLPFDEFVSHKGNTSAYCARVLLESGDILIIPCVELIRFYFGVSSSFLKRLFSGAFALDRLCSNTRFNWRTHTASLDLAEDLSGAAAATVARIAFDRHARSAAAWIINSAIAAKANQTKYYPKTTFPFIGETDLTVFGRWIESSGQRVFLAEQIRQCTCPFPFDSLFYTTRKRAKPILSPVATTTNEKLAEPFQGDVPDVSLGDQAASSMLQPIGVFSGDEFEDPFPDLATKRINRVKEGNGQPPSDPLPDVDALGGGEEVSASTERSAEVYSDDEERFADDFTKRSPPESLDSFLSMFAVVARPTPDLFERQAPRMGWDPNPLAFNGFVRGDDLSLSSDERLVKVWCSLIKINSESPSYVQVLIREGEQGPLAARIDLIELKSFPESSNHAVRYCEEFAREDPIMALGDQLLLSMECLEVTDYFTLMAHVGNALSRYYNQHHRAAVASMMNSQKDVSLEDVRAKARSLIEGVLSQVVAMPGKVAGQSETAGVLDEEQKAKTLQIVRGILDGASKR